MLRALQEVIEMVHVATGNALDVVYDYDESGVQILRGLKQHGNDNLIPLPEPQGLVSVLWTVIAECQDSYRKSRETDSAQSAAGGSSE